MKLFQLNGAKHFWNIFKHKKNELMTCSARYNIEPWNIYNLVSGVTNNAAESLKKTKVNNNDTSDICGLNDFKDLESNSYCSTENNKLKSLQMAFLVNSG